MVPEPPGPNCPAGGEKIEIGIETDAGFQVQQTAYVCNGTNADAGTDVGMDAGGDAVDAGSDDGGALDFSCLGAPLPTTAPDSISVGGTTNVLAVSGGVVQVSSLANVLIQTAGTGTTPPTISSSSGAFSLTVQTGGTPFSGVFQGSASGYGATLVYPAEPLAGDTSDLFVPLGGPTLIGQIASLAGLSQSSGNAFVWVQVKDCGGHPVPNATVSVTTNGASTGTTVYLANGAPSTQQATDTSGEALVFNVPPAIVTVGASVRGMTLRSHDLNAPASSQALTATSVAP